SCTGLVSQQLEQGSFIYQFSYPGTADDPSKRLYGVLHRQVGKKARFVNVYSDGSEPASLRWSAGESIIIENESGQSWMCSMSSQQKEGLKVLGGFL
ncbi:MAG: hypothetical protein K0R67_2981, partial [Paenibacillus sp.]|nr:hypothetical protein [Paenibacillus sp.]